MNEGSAGRQDVCKERVAAWVVITPGGGLHHIDAELPVFSIPYVGSSPRPVDVCITVQNTRATRPMLQVKSSLCELVTGIREKLKAKWKGNLYEEKGYRAAATVRGSMA
ncbi:hypothetical protein NDU88_005152 [Pleurodeles waltl]|uniref:Uncharacterized protein n=1 Tax=Pleurodeles waltl TaxID=8319 RepID=A0AAV7NPR1_PLEWA|nr:hypothetical protein NDU88_005152 [Pleurodeles waltl]